MEGMSNFFETMENVHTELNDLQTKEANVAAVGGGHERFNVDTNYI